MEPGIPLLRDLVVLVAVAIPVVILMNRLRVPTLVGFLLTGIFIGPHALGLVHHLDEVRSSRCRASYAWAASSCAAVQGR